MGAEIRPFAEDELESFHMAASARDQRLADVLLIASWTGLRCSELREARVRDFVRVPMPVLLVSRAAPEGVAAKVTKSGKNRRMPVADMVLPLVKACADGKGPDDLLFTTKTGHRPHATSVKRSVNWSTVAPCRRIHDLRHTAACLWLARGVDPVTVQAWLGHASIATTNIYLHHLGSSADRAGLDRLNALGGAGVREKAGALNDNPRVCSSRRVSAGGRRFGVGAACRNRTDDLLITSKRPPLHTTPQKPSHLRKRT